MAKQNRLKSNAAIINLRIDAELHDFLDKESVRLGITRSAMARLMLRDAMLDRKYWKDRDA